MSGQWGHVSGESLAGPGQHPAAASLSVCTLDPAPARPGWHGHTQGAWEERQREFSTCPALPLALWSGARPGEGQPLGDLGRVPRLPWATSRSNSQLLLCSMAASRACLFLQRDVGA